MKEVELTTKSINTTRSRIVQSPDRIKKHISEMGILAQDERMIIAATEGKSRDLKVKLDALNTFEQVGNMWSALIILLTSLVGYEEVDR